jgi:hypothetical protein
MRSSLLILSLISTLIATSCSVNYHVRKAFDKGYRCEEGGADTIRISTIDSIPYVLRDSIFWEKVLVQKDTIVRYKRSFVPQTRFEKRIEYKLKRDTLRMIEKVEVVKWKTEKNKNKKPNLWLFIIGFIAGFAAKYLMKFAKTTL